MRRGYNDPRNTIHTHRSYSAKLDWRQVPMNILRSVWNTALDGDEAEQYMHSLVVVRNGPSSRGVCFEVDSLIRVVFAAPQGTTETSCE